MPRANIPGLVYFYQGEPVAGGSMFYYESGTTTLIQLYADANESIPITNPVTLDAAGIEPNVFFSGTAKKRLETSLGEQVFEVDPVGGQNVLGNFSDWNVEIIYDQSDIVRKGNDFYISKTSNNQGNDPSEDSNEINWERIYFLKRGLTDNVTLHFYRNR